MASTRSPPEGELDFYVAYFQAHRNAAWLWLDGRVSPTVRAEVLHYNRGIAQRLHGVAVAAGLAAPQTDLLVFLMVVELGDRILDLAFREHRDPDPAVIRHGRITLTAYLAAALRSQPAPPDADSGQKGPCALA